MAGSDVKQAVQNTTYSIGQHLFSFLKQYLVHCTQAWDSF